MIDLQTLRESIERAAAEAVHRYQANLQQSLHDAVANSTNELRRSVIEQVMRELEPELATPPGGAPTDLLNAATASIQDATTQGDILNALLAGAEKFSARCGLFVVRGNQASGWQSRGIDANTFREVRIDVGAGLSERAIRTRGPVAGSIREFDLGFVEIVGAPSDGNVILLPLVVRDRVAALLYADGGTEGATALDASGVELLVRTTDLWLEVISARRAAERGGIVGSESGTFRTEAVPVEAVATVAEPPATYSSESAVAQPVEASAEPEGASAAAAIAEDSAPVQVAEAPPVAPEPPPAELDEIHRKAKRFAKLLVDEIKLYNQGKVSEGRQNRDIYDRLREDIEKSRAAYTKRYAEVVPDEDYFSSELVRILADNDHSLMGGNFQR
jgi:hypothetical protein